MKAADVALALVLTFTCLLFVTMCVSMGYWAGTGEGEMRMCRKLGGDMMGGQCVKVSKEPVRL